MAIVQETMRAEGVYCYRCVERIAAAVKDIEGLALASATPTGEVTIGYDPGREDVGDSVARAIEAIGFPVVDRRTA